MSTRTTDNETDNMSRLLDTLTVPPGGWKYTQPQTDCKFFSPNKDEMECEIFRHREYRGLPRQTRREIGLDIERQICSALNNDPAFCRPE